MSGRVMVVEDESIVAMDIAYSLENMGFHVSGTAKSGEEAINKAEELGPDLILMDINLKGHMDGIQAADIIYRQMDIPVIYLTAFHDSETVGRAKKTEPFGFLVKPFAGNEKLIECCIEVALYKHQAERKRKEINAKLKQAMREMKTIKGVLSICASCKKIHNNKKQWESIESYLQKKIDADFSHTICPECMKKIYPDIDLDN